ncbi:unnamed protein product, partial [Symbiodinium necroappetens]
RSALQCFWMLPANIAVAIYMMTGAADIPSTSRTSAASGEESVAAPAPGPGPLLSPTSDSGETTEPAMEEPSATTPPPAETAPAAPEVVAADGESGSASGSRSPEAWGEILAFLDRPQQARQSALASLPTSDLIRLTMARGLVEPLPDFPVTFPSSGTGRLCRDLGRRAGWRCQHHTGLAHLAMFHRVQDGEQPLADIRKRQPVQELTVNQHGGHGNRGKLPVSRPLTPGTRLGRVPAAYPKHRPVTVKRTISAATGQRAKQLVRVQKMASAGRSQTVAPATSKDLDLMADGSVCMATWTTLLRAFQRKPKADTEADGGGAADLGASAGVGDGADGATGFSEALTAGLGVKTRHLKLPSSVASRLPGMSVRPRLDDPAALVAMLDQLSASPAVRTALSGKGFASLGSLAFAVSDPSDADEVRLFVRSTLSLPDTDASSAAPPKPALGSGAQPSAPAPSASATKIAVPDLLHLCKTFLAKYPGELLTPDSAPSVDFLSLLKNHHDAQQSLWIPWRLRTSESDATRWEEARRPRNDRQLLRSLLDADAEPASASVNLNTQGPSDPVLRRSMSLFATALAMLDQKSVWASVSELIRDHGWSLSDSLNEVAFCRGEMANLLQARPRPPKPLTGPPGTVTGSPGKGDSLERLVALVLDVAKAHRRILIRKQDRGLLCFRHKNAIYQCTTLNFGARVSSFFWARAAGLLVRLVHKLIRVRHSAKIYIDDLLCLLDSVPLSWHKCPLSPRVVWIGWEIDLAIFTVRLDPQKFQRLCALLRQALSSRRCSTHLLERITGKLLWLSSLFKTFRPSLAPLYADRHAFLPTIWLPWIRN